MVITVPEKDGGGFEIYASAMLNGSSDHIGSFDHEVDVLNTC